MVFTDTYRDLRINEERDIEIDGGNDLALTSSRDENINQSVAIATGKVVKQILGSPIDTTTLTQLVSIVQETLSRDPQISQVIDVRVIEVNKANNTITLDVVLLEDENFQLTLTP